MQDEDSLAEDFLLQPGSYPLALDLKTSIYN